MELKIDIWSDCVCPYCYAGKRQLEQALEMFPLKDSVKVIWHSYQLNPYLPKDSIIHYFEFLADALGMSIEETKERVNKGIVKTAAKAGLFYNLDKAIQFNTFDAHRIIQRAKEKGLGNESEEEFFRAFFIDNRYLNDTNEVIACGKRAGLTEEECREALESQKYYDLIWEDFRESDRRGVQVVPTFFFPGGEKVEAAPGPEVLLAALERAAEHLS
jgi:protein disulfide-isomerase